MRITHDTIQYTKALSAAVCALIVGLALVSYCPEDHSIMYDTSYLVSTHNYLGSWGAQLAGLLFYLFGGTVWVFVCISVYVSYLYIFCTVARIRVYYSNISTISMALVISILVSAYIQVYPGACGIYMLECLQAILEPWHVVLFLYCLLWAFSVVCTLEPLCRLLVCIRLQAKAIIKNSVKQNMPFACHKQK